MSQSNKTKTSRKAPKRLYIRRVAKQMTYGSVRKELERLLGENELSSFLRKLLEGEVATRKFKTAPSKKKVPKTLFRQSLQTSGTKPSPHKPLERASSYTSRLAKSLKNCIKRDDGKTKRVKESKLLEAAKILKHRVEEEDIPKLQVLDDSVTIRKIAQILKDNVSYRRVGGKTRGDLHHKALYKVRTSDRLFCKKQEKATKTYNIGLLVDCSGSMRGSSMRRATECALAITKDFQEFSDITVATFNVVFQVVKPGHLKFNKGDLYNMAVDMLSKCKNSSFAYGNHDGYAVREMTKVTHKPKGNTILIVLSDGHPSCDNANCGLIGCFEYTRDAKKHLKSTVKQIEAKGIPIIGIGIDTICVQDYYTNHAAVHELEELYPTILRKLKPIVRRL